MIIVEVYIPLVSNEGAIFTADCHDVFEAYMVAAFGGFSLLPGTVKGGWAHEGVLYRDESRVYALETSTLGDQRDHS